MPTTPLLSLFRCAKLAPAFTPALALLVFVASAAEPPSPKATPPAPPPASDSADLKQLLQRGLLEEEGTRDVAKAAAAFETLLAQHDGQRAIAATALFRLAEIRVKQNRPAEAAALYQRLLVEFPGHETLAPLSRERLTKLKIVEPGAAPGASEGAPLPEEAAELARLRELAANSPDLLEAAREYKDPQTYGTPLHRAASRGWLRVARFLLEQQVAVDGQDGLAKPMLAAASAGHKQFVEFLLDHGGKTAAPPNLAPTLPETPLGAACANGRMEVIKLLLARGADPNLRDVSLRTPLLRACNGGSPPLPIAQLLLERGANPNLAGGITGRVNSQGYAGSATYPPLSLAVERSDLALVKFLLQRGADPNLDLQFSANRPLARAVVLGSDEAVRILLEAGARPDFSFFGKRSGAQNAGGGIGSEVTAPLWYFAVLKDFSVARRIIQAGNLATAKDDSGMTPLHRAVLGDWSFAYQQDVQNPGLGNRGQRVRAARTTPRFPATPPDDDATQLQAFCEFLLSPPQNAAINAASDNGWTPLHFAMNRPELSDDFIRWLISKGADPFLKDKQGFTPLGSLAPEHAMPFERDYLYAKIQRAGAVTVLSRLPDHRSSAPLRLLRQADDAAPPTLASLLWEWVAVRDPYGASNNFVPNGLDRGSNEINSTFEMLVFRSDEKGKFVQAGQAGIDLLKPPKVGDWPGVRWGDIVVLHQPDEGGAIQRLQTVYDWLEKNNAVKPIEPPAPAANPQGPQLNPPGFPRPGAAKKRIGAAVPPGLVPDPPEPPAGQ